MFVQIHMLQSMPPGNLNRDDTGQPKQCIFGGVTRARISSQCLKRNIRRSPYFTEAFPGRLAVRTTYLPKMVAEEARKLCPDIAEDELTRLMVALAKKFKKETKAEAGAEDESEESAEHAEGGEEQGTKAPEAPADQPGQTGQLVFFPPTFARSIADLVLAFRQSACGV